MTLLAEVFARRSVEDPSVPLSWAGLADWLGMGQTDAGITVTERTALNLSAVYRCTNVIASVAAALPLHTYLDNTLEKVPTPLLRDPHPELTAFEFWRLSYVHRCLWGDSYAQKLRNGAGEVKELHPITPDRVRVYRRRSSDDNPGAKEFYITDDAGEVHFRTSRDILHIPNLGYDGTVGVSPIRAAANGIALSLAAEKSSSKFFANGAMLSGVLQVDQRLDDKKADQLKARWRARTQGHDNAFDIAVLDSGATFNPITMPYKDAQFLESRRFQISEIARWFGVPLFLLMETEKSTSWGTGLEQQAQGFLTFDLHPMWLVPTEQRVNKELLTTDRYARYRVQGLLRADAKARAEFYRVMHGVGAMSPNDIRAKEEEPPVEGGDVYLQPLNMVPLGAPPDPAAQPGADPNANQD